MSHDRLHYLSFSVDIIFDLHSFIIFLSFDLGTVWSSGEEKLLRWFSLSSKTQMCFRLRGSGASVTQEAMRKYLRLFPFIEKRQPTSFCLYSFSFTLCYSGPLFFPPLFVYIVLVKCLKGRNSKGICRNCFRLPLLTRTCWIPFHEQVKSRRENPFYFLFSLHWKCVFFSVSHSFFLTFFSSSQILLLFISYNFLLLTVIKTVSCLLTERQKSGRHAHTGHVMNSCFLQPSSHGNPAQHRQKWHHAVPSQVNYNPLSL